MRRKERIPKIMRLLKSKHIFYSFTETDSDYFTYYDFSKKYEELFLYWVENPDLRCGQMLINKGIIPNNKSVWEREDDQWFVKHGCIEPEDIYLWGTYGIDGKQIFQDWYSEKPVLGVPLTDVEKWTYPDLVGEPDHEIYAIRREWWKQRMPKPEYKFIADLEPDHIEKILEIEKVAYRPTFNKVLKRKRQEQI